MAELTIPYWEVVLRLLLASLLCGAIGFEREVRDQPAGFRTHILLGLGATLFTLVSAYGFEPFTRAALGGGGLQFDPTRIAAQVVAGVGFLGAGAIIRQGLSIRGLTTAAGLWVAAAIGMAVGAGLVVLAAGAVAIILALLVGLRHVRDLLAPRLGAALRVVDVQYDRGHGTLGPLLDALRDAGAHVEDLSIDDHVVGQNGDVRAVRVLVRTAQVDALQRAVAEIRRLREVHDARVDPAPS
jgi:putative Mg2+ transporter-C (MgtC) family protein